ncbi:response regulator [Leptobacterium flavescens]|uniref:histidine kinase n=1 Tax=Leptobacterium flavescens TaxID=472055 RepID=A0A6P0UKN8_9FLAO|nr:ATP-binding protein [Leptobacterium flavescens]NER13855.1 response regulator [Leptobacterium flavescens]
MDSIHSAFSLAEEYQARYQLVNSTEKAFDVIRLAKRLENSYYQSIAYNLIGINYETILDFQKAQDSYNSALSHALKIKNDTLTGRIYNNLGNIEYMAYDDFDKSNEYYNKSIDIASKQNDIREVIPPTLNLAWNHLDRDELETAFSYLTSAKSYIELLDELDDHIYINYLFGIYHTKNREYGQAMESFNNAIAIGERLGSFLELSDVYLAQSKLFASINEPTRETAALEKYYEYRLQVSDIENLKQLAIVESNNKDEITATESRDRRNGDPVAGPDEDAGFFEKYKQLIIYALLGLAFAAVVSVIVYRSRKSQKRLTDMLETRNEHLEEAKEEAEKLSRLKSQFISTVSHELRTPLYGVVGLTSLLLEGNTLSSEENQYLKSLKFSGDYLLNLINDILHLSKIESNKVILEKRPFNIRDLVEDVISSFKFQLDQKNNKIHLYIDKKIPPFLRGDEVPLSQILINLIGNAVKFTSYGNIWIFLKLTNISEETAAINFIIKDDGPGIPKEKHDEIFENFSQLDRENNEYQGTGLGLSIVKKLVDLLQGEIKLISDEGEGATFSFNLKFDTVKESNAAIERRQTESVSAPSTMPSESIFGKGYRVLIVEDNKINQIVTKNILLRESFECEVVDNGLSAIEYVKNSKFDLVLMDLNMPLMSGIEASAKIREFDQETPIVALTAVEIEDVKEDIIRAGIDDIINKPFDKSEFYKVIIRNINRRAGKKKMSVS